MELRSREHDELMSQFEREYRELRTEKEPKSLWVKSKIYQQGETNQLFIAYRRGYALGYALGRETHEEE